MPSTSAVRTLINNYFTTNGTGDITGSKAKSVLLSVCDLIDGIFTTFLVVGTGATSTSNGDDVYHTGKMIIGTTTDDGSGLKLQAPSVSVSNTGPTDDVALNLNNTTSGAVNSGTGIKLQFSKRDVSGWQIGIPGNVSALFISGWNGSAIVERMRLDVNGNMGVGTTSPTARLHAQSGLGYAQLRLETSYTPTGSGDTNGSIGAICWDAGFLYIKTAAGWKRAALSTF